MTPDASSADPIGPDLAGRRRSPSAYRSGCAAFAIFWLRVNPLSAWLALGGLLFYVFIYTMWLKRTSPQNIVIGGAAGAFPPLVGWAAMTGRLDLAAVYLFAIIFYWTPPHFWALALIKQADYAKAGIPMMPVVRGEARTKYEMLVYTLILLPLTVMPTLLRRARHFLRRGGGAARRPAPLVLRTADPEKSITPVAWQMYRYSLLYLALLFVAMGVDRALPFGHRAPTARRPHPRPAGKCDRVLRSVPGSRPSTFAISLMLTKASDRRRVCRSRLDAALAAGTAVPRRAAARDAGLLLGGRLSLAFPLVVQYLLDAAFVRHDRRCSTGSRSACSRSSRAGGAQLRPGVLAERRRERRWPGSGARCSPGCSTCRPASSPSAAPAS